LSIIWEKRTLALAGLIQTAHQVSSIARTGVLARDSMEHSLASIFVQNPDSISEVYQGTLGIRVGLNLLKEMLNGFNLQDHGEPLRYLFAVTNLERILVKDQGMLGRLGVRISNLDEERRLRQQDQPGIDDITIVQLAELYQATLSRIEPRIRISGNRQQLQRTANIQRIRALLLAAVRAAVLWRQVGGRRWQFITSRNQMKKALENLV
jgi:high frequency lysogenization protein